MLSPDNNDNSDAMQFYSAMRKNKILAFATWIAYYAKWNKTGRQILHGVTYVWKWGKKQTNIEIVSRKVVARSWDVGEIEIGVCVLNRVQIFATPWTVAHQAPLSIGFPREECWSGLPFLSPGNWIHVSCVSYIGKQILTTELSGKHA